MNIDDIDRRIRAGINFAFLLLIFFLPLLLSTRSSEVFELPKMLFVYSMTTIIVGLWLMRMAMRRKILIRQTPLDIPILLFLLSQIASTIYSIDPLVSWWGWYGRFHGGLWSTISYTLLYYAFVTNFVDSNEESPWRTPRRLLITIIASTIIVSGYAILQHFGVDKDFWVQDVVNRVFSTQGQPNWLAAYLVMAIPLGWALIMSNEQKTENNDREGAEFSKTFIAHCFLLIVFFLALLFTKSRSGLIGLAVADLIFWGLVFIRSYLLKNRSYIDQQRSFEQEPTFSGTKKLYRLSTIVNNLYNFVDKDRDREKISLINLVKFFVLIHILITGLVLATNNPAREWILGRLQVTGYRLQTTTVPAMENGITLRKSEHGGTESGDIRRLVWSGAIQLVKQRPVFGFGPETFGETYWRVRPKEHNLTSEWNFLYNKAHNEWLNLAANTGIFGLGAHLLLLGWFSVWVLKGPALPRQGRALSSYAILAALLGVEAVNFFGFSTVTVGAYRYLFMAWAVMSANREQRTENREQSGHLPFTVYCLLFTVSLAVLYLLSQLFIFFLADLAYNRGRAYQDGGYVEEAIEPLMQAVNLAPGEPVFRAELAEAEGAPAAMSLQRPGLAEQGRALSEHSLANFEIVRRQSPENLGFVRTEARVLFLLQEEERAIQLMKLAMEMAPTNPQLPYSLGVMLSKMGNEEEATGFYNKAMELKPDYPELR